MCSKLSLVLSRMMHFKTYTGNLREKTNVSKHSFQSLVTGT